MTEGDMARDRQELVEIQEWLRDLTITRLVREGMTEADAIAAAERALGMPPLIPIPPLDELDG